MLQSIQARLPRTRGIGFALVRPRLRPPPRLAPSPPSPVVERRPAASSRAVHLPGRHPERLPERLPNLSGRRPSAYPPGRLLARRPAAGPPLRASPGAPPDTQQDVSPFLYVSPFASPSCLPDRLDGERLPNGDEVPAAPLLHRPRGSTSAEYYLVDLFERANLCAINAKRVTINGCPEVSILRRHDSRAASLQENPTRRLEYRRSPCHAASPAQPIRLRAPGLMSDKAKGGAPDSAGSALFGEEAPSSGPDELDQATAAFWGDLTEGVDPYGGDSLPEDKAGGSDQSPSLSDLKSAVGVSCLSSGRWSSSRRQAAAQAQRAVGVDPAPSLLHSKNYAVWHASQRLAGVQLSGEPPARVESCSQAPTPVMSTDSLEERELDLEEAYFKDLVERFIAAAYLAARMNGAATTGSRQQQQEPATSPGASSRSMQARDVRRMESLKGAEEVSTRSGEGSNPSDAKPVVMRMVSRERWTWKHQRTKDGPNGFKVLSLVKEQPTKDSCTPTALGAVMESNLRVQLDIDILLSLKHLIHLSQIGKIKYLDIPAMKRMFFMVKEEGVLSEQDYNNPQAASATDVRRYHIKEFCHYVVDHPGSMKRALYELRNGGPLMGVIRISKNYDACAKSGDIYKYDPNLVRKDKEGNEDPETHAVCVISFAIEDEVPFLECQDSHGDRFGNKGFLKIDVTSLSHLWSIVVA